MALLTYLQQISSRLARWKRLRSLPSVSLEELGLSELANPLAERPPLTMRQYVDLLAGVSLPTDEQKRNFVEYVAHAHSWYKHLPFYPPGAEFYFFIDKYAACDRVVARDGTAAMQVRAEQGFHYSAYPTTEYRARFGHLAYCCGYGTTVVPLSSGPMAIPRDQVAGVPGDDARLYRLPSEILDAGLARLTAVIHNWSMFNPLWLNRLQRTAPEIDWPEKSGGKATCEKAIERAETIVRDHRARRTLSIDLPGPRGIRAASVDAVLYELLAPERTRQVGEMMKAINRVCDLIVANRS